MGRGHLSEFAERFKRVLSGRTVNALGRLTRFCQRERVITPHRMAVSLLASCARGQVQTLADLHRVDSEHVGDTIREEEGVRALILEA